MGEYLYAIGKRVTIVSGEYAGCTGSITKEPFSSEIGPADVWVAIDGTQTDLGTQFENVKFIGREEEV